MSKDTFSWLHLTDFHFGLNGQEFLWPNLREPFLKDLTVLHSKTGPWQAVFFTGDLVQKGSSSEFIGMQKEVLDEIWDKLHALGSGDAKLVAVPGNHDLVRPDTKIDNPAIDTLLDSDRFESIAQKFWSNPNGSYRLVINEAFAPYTAWWNNYSKYLNNYNSGMLPGEFSCTLTSLKGKKIGVLGLNTAFLQLTSGDYKGKLTWNIRQLHNACGGAIDKWVNEHPVRILLTHHGREWLTSKARDHGETEIAPAHRFAVHMFGHMHETSIQYIRNGGSQHATRLLQGCSAFGLESHSNGIMRSHGYSVGKIEFDEEITKLRIWPRLATDSPKGSGWRYLADSQHAFLESDEGTEAELLSGSSTQINPEYATALSPPNSIPEPPRLYAFPPYIGSHSFVGRQSQLDILNDWANSADTHSLLLFEAIGGTGKSILTWEWVNKYSFEARNDWAGVFWYSFYEKGATMLDFCRHALAYMQRRSPEDFRRKNTLELTRELILQLQLKPWLIVLDGLERVLVSYHRFDAAQIRDEDAGKTDEIAQRNPCSAINFDDDELLRLLAGASPSKILASTRLTPKILLNSSNQPIPGVRRTILPGLRPSDAEELFRSCGVQGDSVAIQKYLTTHCDCHPLVIGVLAGLINDYLPDRGNFDTWSVAVESGGKLNLAELDLVQKRNHILETALEALDTPSKQLLSTIALLHGSIDYPTLCSLNPLLPILPEAVPQPVWPKKDASRWRQLSKIEQQNAENEYKSLLTRREEYLQATKKRSEEIRLAAGSLTSIVKNLELRGLLQYDTLSQRYDLHPVVRGIAVGGLKLEEKNKFGQRVVDHFSLRAQDPYMEAESLDDFDDAKNILKTFFQMGQMDQALLFLDKNSSLLETLNKRFEADNEILTILHPFFENGWSTIPTTLQARGGRSIVKRAAISLRRVGALQESIEVSSALIRSIPDINGYPNTLALINQLITLSSTLGEVNYLADEDRLLQHAESLIRYEPDRGEAFYLARYRQLSRLGLWAKADKCRSFLKMPNNEVALHHYVVSLYQRNQLTENELLIAEQANLASKSALGIRNLFTLRGVWQQDQGKHDLAENSLENALALAHKAGKRDIRIELWLAVARQNIGKLEQPHEKADQFSKNLKDGACNRPMAELLRSIGDNDNAINHALAAYKWALADGAPYVRHFEVEKSKNLLKSLGCEPPVQDTYDLSHAREFDFEEKIKVIINQLTKK